MVDYKQLASSASQCVEDIVQFGFCQSSCSLPEFSNLTFFTCHLNLEMN